MKTYKEFIKEINHIQEKLDATVYGQLTLGATPGTATKQQIKSGVDRAIKNVGKKEGSGQIGTKGSYGIKPSGYVSLSYEKKSGGGKTPPPTKVRPDKTTDPKGTKVTPDKPTNTIKTIKNQKNQKHQEKPRNYISLCVFCLLFFFGRLQRADRDSLS